MSAPHVCVCDTVRVYYRHIRVCVCTVYTNTVRALGSARIEEMMGGGVEGRRGLKGVEDGEEEEWSVLYK